MIKLNFPQKPSQTPKLLLATKMFYAVSGMNVSQVGADAEHLPSRTSSSHPWLILLRNKRKEKEQRIAVDILKKTFFFRIPPPRRLRLCSCAEAFQCGDRDNVRPSPSSLRRLRGNTTATAKNVRLSPHMRCCVNIAEKIE